MDEEKKSRVEVKPNGPLIITGPILFENEQRKIEMKRVVICRCGASGNLPFCDATHNRINFQS